MDVAINVINGWNWALATAGGMVLLAVITLGAWNLRRSHAYLLWLAGGHLLSAMAWVWGSALKQQGLQGIGLWLGLMHLFAYAAVAQAVALRMGRQARLVAVAISSMAAMAMVAYWDAGNTQPAVQGAIVSIGIGVILLHIAPELSRASARHAAERRLISVYALGVIAALLLSVLWLWPDGALRTAGLLVLPVLAWLWSGLMTWALVTCIHADAQLGIRRKNDVENTTGLLLRTAFERECGVRPYERRVRVLALCDVDQYQHIHDTYGADVSDEVLRNFAHILQSNVRESDSIAYLGGEAFALGLRHIDMADAQALVQRISHQLRQQHWAYKAPVGMVTVSVGLAAVREADTLATAMHRADVLLYQAKEGGRNRIWVDEIANEVDVPG